MVTLPNECDIGVSYCKMLLHYTLLNDDGFRTDISLQLWNGEEISGTCAVAMLKVY